MSDAPQSAPPPAAANRQPAPWTSVILGAVGVVAIIIGVSKMTNGLSEMFGAGNAAAVKTETEANEAAQRAFDASKEADIKLNELLGALNALSLSELRANHGPTIDQAIEQLGTTVDGFRTAAHKLDDLLEIELPPTLAEFYSLKSEMYRTYAEGYDHRRTLANAMKDAAITDKAALLATINEIAPLADAAIAAGSALAPKLEEVTKQLSEQN